MLELISVARVLSRHGQESLQVLEQVSFAAPKGHLMAIVGAPGSGKSTLIGILAGLLRPTGGSVIFQGKDCVKQRLHPNSIGHVPAADDVLNAALTVRESVMSALMLRVADQTRDQRVGKASHLLVGLGLETLASQRVSTLTLPQRRRLKLALALVSDPALVVCDEFTDGLDVKSEQELTALLKFVAADHPARVVIHATQTLGNLPAYDTVVILHEGRVCFHGPSRAVSHYFSVTTVEELYPRLAKRPAQRWGDSWTRHRDSYYDAFKLGNVRASAPEDEEDGTDPDRISPPTETGFGTGDASTETACPPAPALPSVIAQAKHLIQRRWTTLHRSTGEWSKQLAIFLLSPVVAALLVSPNMHFLKDLAAAPGAPALLWPAAYTCAMALFVQILLVLMMSVRNGAREIAAERAVYEREQTGGLRTSAYLLGKLGFLIPIVLLQCFSLGLFLDMTTGSLPGHGLPRLLLLALTGLAFTSLCLGISAHNRSAERAHSACWMLLFANVLLAGALLGFPRILGGVLQPLSTAYYGWSGSVETLNGTAVFEPLTQFVRTWFATPVLAISALGGHFVVGIVLTLTGLRRGR